MAIGPVSAILESSEADPGDLALPSHRIITAVDALDKALDAAPPEAQMLAVFGSVEQLVTIYLKIAKLNDEFHSMCENGGLPLRLFN
jgi:hypothetical protein